MQLRRPVHRTHASGIYKGSVAIGRPWLHAESVVNTEADPDGYLYGRVVVFTGTLMSMTATSLGKSAPASGQSPSRHDPTTNVLVVGDINPAVLRPGSNVTGKARKAFELQDKGQPIEVMTEDDFLRCLDGKPLDGTDTLLGSGDQSQEPPATAPVSSRLRKVSLADRPIPKPPKPLRRERIPTDQMCSVGGCPNIAAFRTRSKPTWCDAHIAELQRRGGTSRLKRSPTPTIGSSRVPNVHRPGALPLHLHPGQEPDR